MTALPRGRVGGGPGVRAGTHEGLLQARVIGRAESVAGPAWLALLIEEGRAEIRAVAETETVAAPALVWRPWQPGLSAHMPAGTVAAHIVVGANALFNAIGHKPESQDVRALAETALVTPVDLSSPVGATLRACFAAVHREALGDRPAASTLIEAYLHILLIEIWRSRQGRDLPVRPNTPSERIFGQFTALVEQNFRNRWTVDRYASALGLSRDRLGDVCTRVRGRSPKEIVDRRTEREARLLLQNSTNSIEQIAGLLGFQSAAQFNRFFRRLAGQPPGQLRDELVSSEPRDSPRDSAGLHDWP